MARANRCAILRNKREHNKRLNPVYTHPQTSSTNYASTSLVPIQAEGKYII